MNRLGYDGSSLVKSISGFIDFTNKTLTTVAEAESRGQVIIDTSDPNKLIFYLQSVIDDRYVDIIEYDGKLASIMSSDRKYIVKHFLEK